ncbi:MAG: outer membrane protein assembly factor BamB [Sulfuriferula sp.]
MSIRFTILLLLLASLSGCAGLTHKLNPVNWFSSSEPAEKPAPLVQFKPIVTITTHWQVIIGKNADIAFTPAVAIDAIYVASAKGNLARINPVDGKIVWERKVKFPISAGVGANADNEFLGTLGAKLISFDATGKQNWTSILSSEVLGVPKVSDSIVVVRTEDGFIYGLDVATGKQKWAYQHTLPELMLRSQPSVLITKGAIFAGYPGGKLVALSLDTGNMGWEAEVAIPHGASQIERVSDVASTPVADDNQVCAVAYKGRVACFEIHSGNLLWSRNLSSTAGLTMDDDNVYVTDDDGNVIAFDKTHGTSLWKQTLLHARHPTAPVRIGSYLAVGDMQGYVHLLALDDGHFVGRAATDGTAIISQPQEYNNELIVQTAKGNVYALALQ